MDFLGDLIGAAVGIGEVVAVGAAIGAVGAVALGGYAVNPISRVSHRGNNVNFEHAFAQAATVRPVLPYQVPRPYTGGRVRGLFIGINYRGTNSALSGCVNDVRTMLQTLQKVEFPLQECCILVDDQSFPGFTAMPTRDNIIRHMAWLVKDTRPGDVLFFHFSGHGTQVPTTNSDEDDGMDECICPLDYNSAGVIVDDDVFKMLVGRLPAGVRLTALFDCCHSGTVMDLPFEFVGSGNIQLNNSLQMRKNRNKNFAAGDVVMFSGCADSQTSADVGNTTTFGTGSNGAGGAATQALTWALTNTRGLSYAAMILQMRDVLVQRKFKQVPQLSSTKPVDLHRPFSLFGSLEVNQQLMYHVPQQYLMPMMPGPGGYAPQQQPAGYHPAVAGYPPQAGGYPPQQPGFPPPQQGYPSQTGYPPQQAYSPHGGYPPQQGYPPQPGYPPQVGYPSPQQPTYPPQSGYPPQAGYPPHQPGYPPQQYPPTQPGYPAYR